MEGIEISGQKNRTYLFFNKKEVFLIKKYRSDLLYITGVPGPHNYKESSFFIIFLPPLWMILSRRFYDIYTYIMISDNHKNFTSYIFRIVGRKKFILSFLLMGMGITTTFTSCNAPFPEEDFWSLSSLYYEALTQNTELTLSGVYPRDGSTGIKINEKILFSFDAPIAQTTLSLQAANGACTGNVQISSDNFLNCQGGSVLALDGNQTFIISFAGNLSDNTNYKLKITQGVQSTLGLTLTENFEQSTGFTTYNPASAGAMIAWLRADINGTVLDAGSLPVAAGNPVVTWRDQSGNNNHGTQPVAINQPTYNTGIINGLPALNFNGASSFMSITGGFLNGRTSVTMFVVLQYGGVATFPRRIMGTSNAGTDAFVLMIPNVAGNITFSVGVTGDLVYTATSGITRNGSNDSGILAIRARSSNLEIRDNGFGTINATAWGGTSMLDANTDFFLGNSQLGGLPVGGEYFPMDLAEIIIYNGYLSNANFLTVACYLSVKYALSYNGCT